MKKLINATKLRNALNRFLRIDNHSALPKGYNEIKTHLTSRYKGWEVASDNSFELKNLTIYYRKSHKEWRIRADGMGLMDITTIPYPFTDESWVILHRAASQHYA